jgi:hypothetical protein
MRICTRSSGTRRRSGSYSCGLGKCSGSEALSNEGGRFSARRMNLQRDPIAGKAAMPEAGGASPEFVERFQDGEFDGGQLSFNEIGADLRIPVAGSASFLEVSL